MELAYEENLPMYGDLPLRLELEEPDDELKEKARIELRETPEVVAESLREFKELAKGEPNFNLSLDDNGCTRYLRPCKWYPKSGFNLMKRYCQFKLKYPNIYDNLTPEKTTAALNDGLYMLLPLRDRNNCRIFLANTGKRWNPKTVAINEMFRTMCIQMMGILAEPKTQIAGVHVIMDLDGLSLTHATYITPSFAAMLTEFVQRCLPCRLKGIHIVNQPFIFNMIFAIFKPFLQEKTRKRIIFHGRDRASLNTFFENEILPNSLGGKVDISNPDIGKKLAAFTIHHKAVFSEDTSYGYTT